MKQRFAKFIALALAVIMIVTAFPVSAYTGAQNSADGNDRRAAKDFLDWIAKPIADQFKPSYPAQTMEDNVLGGTSVHVDAPRGALPADTELDVVTIADLGAVQDAFDAASDERGHVFAAVDINFVNNGEEVDPRKPVTVILDNSGIAGLENIRLVHFKGGADEIDTAEMEVVEQFYVSGQTITFDAEDFSVYAVIDDGGNETQLLTVEFYAMKNGSWEKINAQAIRMSKIASMDEPVFDPGVPTITTAQSFEGWASEDDLPITDDTVGLSVAEINDGIKETYNAGSPSETIKFYAMVYNVRYVVYHDQAGAVLMTQAYHVVDATTPADVKIDWAYVGFKGNQNFVGWIIEDKIEVMGDYPLYKDNVGTIYKNGTTYNLSETLQLYPYLKSGHWLTFDNWLDQDQDSTSASYTSPAFVAEDESTVAPATPNRTGYEFKGWFTDKQFTKQFIFGSPLNEDATVYAKWQAKNTTYQIVYWTQKITDTPTTANADKEYDFFDSRKVTALTGSTAALETADTTFGDVNGTYGRLGFYFVLSGNTNVNQTAVVKGDGSTTLNVYYDRKVITFKFYETDKTTLWTPTGGYVAATNGDYYYYEEEFETGYYLIGWPDGPLPSYQPVSGDTVYYYDSYNDSSASSYPLPSYSSVTKYSATLVTTYGGSHTMSSSNTYSYYTANEDTWIWNAGSSVNYPYRPLYYKYTAAETGYYPVGTGPDPDAVGTHNLSGGVGSNTISGLYGAQLGELDWPKSGSNYVWSSDVGSDVYDYPLGVTEYVPVLAPGESAKTEVKFYLKSDSGTSMKIFYVGQELGGDEYNQVLLSGENTINPNGGNWYPNETIQGFKVCGYWWDKLEEWNDCTEETAISLPTTATQVSNRGDLYIAFNRLTYDFSFYSNNTEVTPDMLPSGTDLDKVPYGFDLSAFMSAVPTNGPVGCYFDGWYADPAFNTAYNFNSTMPANNIRVYAKWTVERFRVILDPTGQEAGVTPSDITFPGNQVTTFRVDYGELVQSSSINNAQREGYTLLGWFLDKEFTQPFNFNSPITDEIADMSYADASDEERQGTDPWNSENPTYTDVGRDNVRGKVVIYAHWRQNPDGIIGINVHYDATDKDGNTGKFSDNSTEWNDPNLYADKAKAFGQPASTPDDTGLQFLYWEILDANNNNAVVGKAYPGQLWEINASWAKVTDLTAKAVYYTYGDAEPEADKTATAPSREGMRADNPTYRKVTTLTEGKRYLITYTNGSTAYIMGNTLNSNNYINSVSATVSSNAITGDYDQYLFGVDIDSSGNYQFGNINTIGYLGLATQYGRGLSLKASSGYNTWTLTSRNYLQNTAVSTSAGYPIIQYNGGTFRGNDSSNDSNQVITFYERVEDEITGQEFELTTELTVGNRYIIAIGDYAVGNQPLNSATNDHFIKGVRVKAQTSSVIVPTDDVDTATWEIVSGSASAGYVFKNVGNGTYLGMSSDGQCYLAATTEALASHWTYDNGTDLNNHVTESANASGSTYFFYLSYAGAFLDFTTATYTGQGVKLYAASKSYTVTFVDGCPGFNDAVISTATVEEGGNAVPPEAPDHTAAGYVFTGWDTDYSNVHANITVRALYQSVDELEYTVIFRYMDSQGNWVESAPQTVQHGHAATEPTIPDPPAGYTFNSWDKKFTNVTSSMTINAVYKQEATKKYEITLRAVYGRANTSAKTHIYWFANNDKNGVNGGDVQRDLELGINEAITIPTPSNFRIYTGSKAGENTLAYEDHIFLGWARIDNDTGTKPEGVAHPHLNEDDIFLAWDAENNDFIVRKKIDGIDDVDVGRHVTKVAADEAHPYHDMYAVWADVFYVYHSGTNQVEKIVRTTKDGAYDLAGSTTENFLYGGYYHYYDGVSSKFTEEKGAKVMTWNDVKVSWNANGELVKDASWTQNQHDDKPEGGTAAKAYNGYNVKWTSVAYKQADGADYGDELKPEAGTTYYIKEVPADKYLRPYLHYTYYYVSYSISTAWLISDVDLSYTDYQQTGYVITSKDNEAQIVRSLTVTTTNGNNTQTLSALSLFGTRGYLNYLTVINRGSNGQQVVNLLNNGDSVLQYWVTPDGLMVTGTAARVYTGLENQQTIGKTETDDLTDDNSHNYSVTHWVPGD